MNAAVSYIMPAFNCSTTVAESIGSILHGNLAGGDEIVVVDDGSTDDTAIIVADLADRHSAIRLVKHTHNRGGAAARNTAVEQAKHDTVFCLDSDNLLAPNSVFELRHFLTATHADAAAFHELRYFKDAAATTTHIWQFRSGPVSLADHLAGKIVPGASGNYLYTKLSWFKAGGYPESAGALDAWGFGLRQVATGQRMMVMPSGHYHHRYGHQSYWIRDVVGKNDQASIKASQLLSPFFDRLAKEDVDYILSPSGQKAWFKALDHHPIRVLDGNAGRAGVELDTTGRVKSKNLLWKRLKARVRDALQW